jgi:hypothetical protein
MAGNGGDRSRGVAGRIPKEVQKELGILAVSLEQCFMDCVGLKRSSLRAHLFAALPRFP